GSRRRNAQGNQESPRCPYNTGVLEFFNLEECIHFSESGHFIERRFIERRFIEAVSSNAISSNAVSSNAIEW
ncbi:MAG: hypothetical protein PV344_04080, partial [Anaplasma sp.]|nr:hypothetical protein [Anaplasma sp.]